MCKTNPISGVASLKFQVSSRKSQASTPLTSNLILFGERLTASLRTGPACKTKPICAAAQRSQVPCGAGVMEDRTGDGTEKTKPIWAGTGERRTEDGLRLRRRVAPDACLICVNLRNLRMRIPPRPSASSVVQEAWIPAFAGMTWDAWGGGWGGERRTEDGGQRTAGWGGWVGKNVAGAQVAIYYWGGGAYNRPV